MREKGAWLRSPVNEPPGLGAPKILADVLESVIVLKSGLLGEAREKGDGVANIDTSDDVCIDQFAEDLTVGETNRGLQSAVIRGTFGGAGWESLENLCLTDGEGD